MGDALQHHHQQPPHRARAHLRGASSVEYIAIAGALAVLALAGVRLLGRDLDGKSDEMAVSVATLEGTEGTAAAVTGAVFGADGDVGANKKAVEFDTTKFANASPRPVVGRPTIEGAGDGRAVHPNDVSQGQIANCYLISSLAEVALVAPEVIERGIVARGDGTFAVTLYEQRRARKRFEKVTVIVDGKFPCNNGGDPKSPSPLFCQPGDKDAEKHELWPMLYEKAFAQWKGGYSAIGNGGSSPAALEAITGKKSEAFTPDGIGLEEIAKRVQQKHAVVIGTPKESEHALFKNDTLVRWHGYYVVGADAKARTVTLRNPWGWEGNGITLPWDDFRGAVQNVYTNPGGR